MIKTIIIKGKLMNQVKKQCAECVTIYEPKAHSKIFCSLRCEERFHEYAPIALIERVYRENAEPTQKKYEQRFDDSYGQTRIE